MPAILKSDLLKKAEYFAPRGRLRLYGLAAQLGQMYLKATDRLIGVIGAEGSGKSTLIKGLFPGLELTNDDDGINMMSSRAFDFDPEDQFCGHTFHMDIRYEMAFHQIQEIVETIKEIVHDKRRIVVEHFDLIYPHLEFNAQILFSIGEYVSVCRPTLFGPTPSSLRDEAYSTLKFRLMAHTAEDIVGKLLQEEYGIQPVNLHSELQHGFVIKFEKQPDINIAELQNKALSIIGKDISVSPGEGDHVLFDGVPFYCTGKRCHVKSTGLIENFRMLPGLHYDPLSDTFLLIGIVGNEFLPIEKAFDVPPIEFELIDKHDSEKEWQELASYKGRASRD